MVVVVAVVTSAMATAASAAVAASAGATTALAAATAASAGEAAAAGMTAAAAWPGTPALSPTGAKNRRGTARRRTDTTPRGTVVRGTAFTKAVTKAGHHAAVTAVGHPMVAGVCENTMTAVAAAKGGFDGACASASSLLSAVDQMRRQRLWLRWKWPATVMVAAAVAAARHSRPRSGCSGLKSRAGRGRARATAAAATAAGQRRRWWRRQWRGAAPSRYDATASWSATTRDDGGLRRRVL
ncbi:unnamed protein product [Phaeothamnion confervicola]